MAGSAGSALDIISYIIYARAFNCWVVRGFIVRDFPFPGGKRMMGNASTALDVCMALCLSFEWEPGRVDGRVVRHRACVVQARHLADSLSAAQQILNGELPR